ncbi:MAG: hypothetical protein KJZ75_04830 [Hyphomonadaceae bacterium]|nr:hypothetical protein [Hyphomonadaceae bacterium]
MNTHYQPAMTRDRIDALAAAIWACVRRLIWLALFYPLAGRKRAMRRQVRRFEYLVECLLVLRADRLVRPPPGRPRHRFAPTGFRRVQSSGRLLMRLARIRLRRGSLLARLVRLVRVLRAPERYIARFVRRMRRGVCVTHLVPVAPPARRFTIRAAPALPALADSS